MSDKETFLKDSPYQKRGKDAKWKSIARDLSNEMSHGSPNDILL